MGKVTSSELFVSRLFTSSSKALVARCSSCKCRVCVELTHRTLTRVSVLNAEHLRQHAHTPAHARITPTYPNQTAQPNPLSDAPHPASLRWSLALRPAHSPGRLSAGGGLNSAKGREPQKPERRPHSHLIRAAKCPRVRAV